MWSSLLLSSSHTSIFNLIPPFGQSTPHIGTKLNNDEMLSLNANRSTDGTTDLGLVHPVSSPGTRIVSLQSRIDNMCSSVYLLPKITLSTKIEPGLKQSFLQDPEYDRAGDTIYATILGIKHHCIAGALIFTTTIFTTTITITTTIMSTVSPQ